VTPDLNFLRENQGARRALILTACTRDHIGAGGLTSWATSTVPVYSTASPREPGGAELEGIDLDREVQIHTVKPKQK